MRPPNVFPMPGKPFRLTSLFYQNPLRYDRYSRWRAAAKFLQLSKAAKHRLEWIIWYETHGQNALATARHFGIASKTFHKWHKLWNETNLRTLEDRSRAPRKRREREITPLQEKRIVELKEANIRYGKLKISTLYEQAYGERISSWKIQKTIEKYQLYYHLAKQARINRKRQRSVRRKRITELKNKKLTGFLLCLDTIVIYWKGLKRYIFTAVDKYSKIAFARMYSTKSSFNARDFLYRLNFLLAGKIKNVGHDNGSEFKGYFSQACRKLAIEQYHSRIKTPKDNATNERFNRTLEEEFIQMGNMTTDTTEFNRRLTEWLIEYNFRRPHQSLGYLSPINFIYRHQRLLPMYPSSTRG
jgi:transposase InsO family protein